MENKKLNWFDRMMVDITFAEAGIDIRENKPEEKTDSLNWFDRIMIEVSFAEAGLHIDNYTDRDVRSGQVDATVSEIDRRSQQSRRPTVHLR